ncbi:GTP-binding protein [Oribacterium sp. HCP3S3_B9]|uniref:GTP-binding protein n=1 Tax=Oribacterium sp. HCP3S3_B9 TaxID=3438946 RepID=UPI003F8C0513
MITIDLITGFLGSGKTTFIEKYARWLVAKGERVCILENDYGAINIDRVLLQDLLGPNCELEMVVGGDGAVAHQRRFRTKLISMAMLGYTRVLVEPSGIYDIDEFFDSLYEEPLDRWYEVGSVLTIVDARLDPGLSPASRYLLASEAAGAGKIILSKLPVTLSTPKHDKARPEANRTAGIDTGRRNDRRQRAMTAPVDNIDQHPERAQNDVIAQTLAILNQVMEEVQCARRFAYPADVLAKPWDQLEDSDFQMLEAAGYRHVSFLKKAVAEEDAYQSLFYMHYETTPEDLQARVLKLLADPAAGHVLRIKGFSSGFELNVTKDERHFRPLTAPTEDVIIVIGEGLRKDIVAGYFPGAVTV